jgi:hypothetical protein
MTLGCFSALLPVKKPRREPQAEAEQCLIEKVGFGQLAASFAKYMRS